jgi:hypothetical protein
MPREFISVLDFFFFLPEFILILILLVRIFAFQGSNNGVVLVVLISCVVFFSFAWGFACKLYVY